MESEREEKKRQRDTRRVAQTAAARGTQLEKGTSQRSRAHAKRNRGIRNGSSGLSCITWFISDIASFALINGRCLFLAISLSLSLSLSRYLSSARATSLVRGKRRRSRCLPQQSSTSPERPSRHSISRSDQTWKFLVSRKRGKKIDKGIKEDQIKAVVITILNKYFSWSAEWRTPLASAMDSMREKRRRGGGGGGEKRFGRSPSISPSPAKWVH